jgi:hypothetical protein
MTSGLRRFIDSKQAKREEPQVERCELCSVEAGEHHGHVVDMHSRNILCACRPCYMLFNPDGSTGQRFKSIPDRHLYTDNFKLDRSTWDKIGIPVRMAFFFTNSEVEGTVAFYPSPAGATESLLDLDAWARVLEENPAFADATADVEALLVNRIDDTFECYLVPIDACYRLTGLVKLNWRGFDGGTEAWEKIDGFFAELREGSERVGGEVQ